MTFAIDFDQTIAITDWPDIIRDVPNAFKVLKRIKESKHKVILLTMRSDKYLQEAIDFAKEHDFTFDYINDNPTQKRWSNSPKVYADYYIDDKNILAPLLRIQSKDVIDWTYIEKHLVLNKIIK